MGENTWRSLSAWWESLDVSLTPEGRSVLLGSLLFLAIFPLLGYLVFFSLPGASFQWWDRWRLRDRRRVLVEIVFALARGIIITLAYSVMIAIGIAAALALFVAYPKISVAVLLLFVTLFLWALVIYFCFSVDNSHIPTALALISARIRAIYKLRRWPVIPLALILVSTTVAVIFAVTSDLFSP